MTDAPLQVTLKPHDEPRASLSRRLGLAGVRPSTLAAMCVCVAVLGAALLCAAGGAGPVLRAVILALAAGCIVLRLLAGRLALEVGSDLGGQSALAPLWIALAVPAADVLLLLGAGYSAAAASRDLGPALGWLGALLVMISAYLGQLERGAAPEDVAMSVKARGMAALFVAALISAAEPLWGWRGQIFVIALGLLAIALGAAAIRRAVRLAGGRGLGQPEPNPDL